MVIDIHIHFISPRVFEVLRRRPGEYGVRLLAEGEPRLQVGDETTLAAASLLLGGTLDRVPGLTPILIHGGGFLPYHLGRFDRGHRARPEVRHDGVGLPSSYARRFYYNTLTQLPAALAYLVEGVGADRVLLGSDHPFWLGDPEPPAVVREAGVSAQAQAAIVGENAARLFHLPAD